MEGPNQGKNDHGKGFSLQWGRFTLDLSGRPCVMGIINTTPDSFSDGGKFFAAKDAVAHGLELVSQGADILDIGGESSRPFSEPVSLQEEMDRVIPVVEQLASQIEVPISVDTVKSEVARAALETGAAMINDISAMEQDPAMADLVVEKGVPIILMHMKGIPATMQVDPQYDDFLGEVTTYLKQRADIIIADGVPKSHVILDPGIGFGKTVAHNLMLIKHLDQICRLGFPVLMGPSRKSFIQKILAEHSGGSIAPMSHGAECGTMGSVAASIMNGAHIVRVHDVASARAVADIVHAVQTV